MEIRISIVEVATKIAENRLKEIYKENNQGKTDEEIDRLIYVQSDKSIYSEDAQLIFDEEYDKYYTILEKSKIPGVFNYDNPDVVKPNNEVK